MLGQLIAAAFARPAWVLCAALGLAVGVQTVRLHHTEGSLASTQRQHLLQQAQAAETARGAEAAARRVEERHQAAIEEASHELQATRAANAAATAAVRADADRMRRSLAAYASGSAAPATAAATCPDRADRLGDVLADVLRDYAEAVGAAEDRAADSRALLDAWPR